MTATKTPAWWRAKADCITAGWRQRFNEPQENEIGDHSTPFLSTESVALLLAVADHETSCGDAWPGEHNWGAAQKPDSLLSPGAKLARSYLIAHLAPSVANVDAGRKMIEHFALDHEALHVDSVAKIGADGLSHTHWYWQFFWAFPDDWEGAAYFVRIFGQSNFKAALAVLRGPSPTSAALAQGMYDGHYYDGSHPRTTPEGRAANVHDYTTAIDRRLAAVRAALVDWTPSPRPAATPEPGLPLTGIDLSDDVMHGRRLGLDALDFAAAGVPRLDPPDDAA